MFCLVWVLSGMFVLFKPFFDILAKAGAVGFYQYRKIFDIVLAFGHVLTKKRR